ncbi:MAG TPA: hypothetical protein DEB42_07020 [Jeotgalicoccus sp.]|nr:hypothetical protein [Jeotgalicoccus sp.]
MNDLRKIHLQILDKFNYLKGKTFSTFQHTFLNQPPDKFVDVNHHLLSKVRGVYVPKEYDYAFSIKISIDSHNYQNEVYFEESKVKIKYYLPNKNLDSQKARDILAIGNNYHNSIPVGIVIKESNMYSVLGLGLITDLNDDFIHIICDIDQNVETKYIKETAQNFVTESKASVKVRLKQGYFKDRLLTKYNSCCLCGCDISSLLVASHIKPWSKSNSIERLDINNGLLLCAAHDALFDKGIITFNSDGKIHVSNSINSFNREILNLNTEFEIEINKKMVEYLDYHQKYIFK